MAHSTNAFPSRTGQDFLEFLTAIAATDLTHIPRLAPGKIPGHASGRAGIRASPEAAGFEFRAGNLFRLTAMRFINKDGVGRYGRYRILPEAGNEHLDAAAAAAKGPNYLFDEIEHRIAR